MSDLGFGTSLTNLNSHDKYRGGTESGRAFEGTGSPSPHGLETLSAGSGACRSWKPLKNAFSLIRMSFFIPNGVGTQMVPQKARNGRSNECFKAPSQSAFL